MDELWVDSIDEDRPTTPQAGSRSDVGQVLVVQPTDWRYFLGFLRYVSQFDNHLKSPYRRD
jgi:hypothetical protein